MAPPDELLHVRHFGARVGVAGGGGIASVIAVHGELPYDRVRPTFVTTSHLGARLHSAQHVPGALAALATARLDRRTTVVHVHLAGGGSLVREGGVVRLARTLRLPTVVTVHASDLADAAVDHRARLRAVLRAAHVVHVLGAASATIVRDVAGADLPVVTVPNCVTFPSTVTDAGENPPIALFAGEQSLRKGLDVLLAAWPTVHAAVPSARLVIAGNERDVHVPPTVGVDVLGAVPRVRVTTELRGARVAVLPSRRETQPMFILEAMAAARPVVATAISEIPRTVADASALVPPGDADALAHALLAHLLDADHATRCGRAERAHAMAEHSPEAAARAFEKIYATAIDAASERTRRR